MAGFGAPKPHTDHVADGDGSSQYTWLQTIGLLLFVVTAGFPALEMNGFGFGLRWSLPTFLMVSLIGGALGGFLLAPDCRWAGLVGGAIAGPCGLLVLHWWVAGRNQVWKLELVLVQGIASLPGIGVYYLLRMLAPKPAASPDAFVDDDEGDDDDDE